MLYVETSNPPWGFGLDVSPGHPLWEIPGTFPPTLFGVFPLNPQTFSSNIPNLHPCQPSVASHGLLVVRNIITDGENITLAEVILIVFLVC